MAINDIPTPLDVKKVRTDKIEYTAKVPKRVIMDVMRAYMANVCEVELGRDGVTCAAAWAADEQAELYLTLTVDFGAMAKAEQKPATVYAGPDRRIKLPERRERMGELNTWCVRDERIGEGKIWLADRRVTD